MTSELLSNASSNSSMRDLVMDQTSGVIYDEYLIDTGCENCNSKVISACNNIIIGSLPSSTGASGSGVT